MCGICGIYNFDSTNHVQPQIIQKMSNILIHRGPDDEGKFVEKNIGLGIRRLNIIDLYTGHQPIHNEDKSIWIVYNGEIYNYLELRDELIKKGHIFYTKTDTEVIVHLYEEEGEDCVKSLCGMFAFAIWDNKRKSLILARDRLGIKPLYYLINDKGIIFASEIKSIFETKDIDKEIDIHALNDYFTFWYVPAPRTIFKNIKKLLPGHMLIINDNKIIEKEYWELYFYQSNIKDERYFLDRFMELLHAAVKKRLRSDVPLGVLLSGGMDSSTIVALMTNMVNQQIKTFSIGFDIKDEAYNELNYARLVADYFNTEHHEIIINAKDFAEFLPKMCWYMDEPVADRAAVPLYYVSKLAKEHVTVVLSGEGGDELLAGYNGYGAGMQFYNRAKFYLSLPLFIRKKIANSKFLKKYISSSYIHAFLENPDIPISSYSQVMLEGMTDIFNLEEKQQLFSQDLISQINLSNSKIIYKRYYKKTNAISYLNQRLYVDTKLWLADDLLIKADKMTMANSIELRVPFLDHYLVEFAATLPDNLKLKKQIFRGYVSKYILKKGMDKILPKQILIRKKQGFPTPTKHWLKQELKDLIHDILLSSSLTNSGYFNTGYIKELLYNYEKNLALEPQLWTLLIFELFRRNIR